MITTLAILCAAISAPVHQGELIFLPNPKHNHGSCIAELPGGDLLAVWFHGSGERQSDDVMLQGARKTAGGAWSEPFEMADTPNLPDCNPVLYVDQNQKLWLFWITVQDNQWGGSLLKCRTSTNYAGPGAPVWEWQDVIHTRPERLEEEFTALLEGADEKLKPVYALMPNLKEEVAALGTAAHTKLTQRLGWMTRTQPIITQDGRLMLGLYSDVFNCSLAAWTSDSGKTWSYSEPIVDQDIKLLGNVQPAFVQKKSGDIVTYMRDNGLPNRVRTSTSTDGGKTWGPVTGLEIRDSGASVVVLALKSGRWVLVNNDLPDGRHRLSIHVSEDEGATWPIAKALEEREKDKGSFSYPSIIQAADGNIHVSYSFKEEGVEGSSIKHAWFNEEWLTTQE